MLSLDEAIAHCEEVAEEEKKQAIWLQSEGNPNYENCVERAKKQRQLAEWLKELKALRENEEVKEVFKNCDTCAYESIPPDSYPCDRCCHRYPNQYEYDNTREVNADDTNRCEN